ncbi:MAG: pantetheine-phosphate adenylyltransferase [Desulfovibrio sp.]|nr:pantetheine-phosphate adenylyltransferase [Desulfovibrio sp.]
MKIALYPGTFDPITNGHISLVNRGLDIFDHIIVAVAKDTPKSTLFTLEERVFLAKQSLANDKRVSVESYSGLTVTYALQRGACALLRGLRAVSDFEMEFQLALMNRRLEHKLQTIFLMTEYKWLYISSTIIKSAASQGGSVEGLVPEIVRKHLEMKYQKPQTEHSQSPANPLECHPDQLTNAGRC